jgi:methylthioribose-1-phosphate isomerase
LRESSTEMPVQPIRWKSGLGDGCVELIDQTQLPGKLVWMECRDARTMFEAIRMLRVRGAPAIGVAAAMGMVLAVRDAPDDENGFFEALAKARDYLASSRPTAVNLFWALDRMVARAMGLRGRPVPAIKQALLAEALTIQREDANMCRSIGGYGADLIPRSATVLTHCNAGSLATAEYGTALAAVYTAFEQGKKVRVFADETRPLLQGARLTAWELQQAGVPVTVVCDSAAGWLMQQKKVDLVFVGADRIAANGDTANKIGTYSLAVLAKRHSVPFYVAAPSSTFDLSLADGSAIPIETRSDEEIGGPFALRVVPEGVGCYNPAFDVTPSELICSIVTERGVIHPVCRESIRDMLAVCPKPE